MDGYLVPYHQMAHSSPLPLRVPLCRTKAGGHRQPSSGSFPLVRLRIGLGKRAVRRCRGPADHDQKYIEDKQRDGDVVEQRRLGQIGHSWLAAQKRKATASMAALANSIGAGRCTIW